MSKTIPQQPINPPRVPQVSLLTVTSNSPVARQVYQMTLKGDGVKAMVEPGQFVHMKCGSTVYPLLRRPLSICDVDKEKQELTIIYRVEGEGTRYLSRLQAGDTVDVLGPLGRGFPLKNRIEGERVLIVGGGVGVPPLYYLSKCLTKRGVEVTHILGFNSREDSFLTSAFEQLGETYVTSMDGSLGHKGMVTDMVERWAPDDWQAVYACGPLPMLKAVEQYWSGCPQTEVYLSLEQRMGCGVGACLACVCHTPDSATSYKKVCTDGPVFKLGEVML
ncbi:dihydroorotate dehydrogenase B (NAD(+)), electron transfer subunit [Caldalkalibacillus thermarum]|uniref:dihydroorotate dehydrogenase electron transfer subunit n=1 Tax=Caldalkalibacillus thermarum TaxID=296745 RepID=UPI001663281F|nr:dihydroorotate dehydrogenase electron transfer subunit [Caldalkalibacillus thermarum]GGK14005.1 dihydroorotate dehydrogenase B (NAD(+)), electron transfer subunit [Caldalkalibacillus thermarum]